MMPRCARCKKFLHDEDMKTGLICQACAKTLRGGVSVEHKKAS